MSEEFLVVKGTLEPSLPKQTQHCFSWAGFAPGAPNVLPKITSSNHKCKILPFTFRASHLPWESPQLLFCGKTLIEVKVLLNFIKISRNFLVSPG